MRLPSQQSVWLLFLGAAPSLAVFADFEFAGNNGTNAKKLCGGVMPFECPPPSMCSKDTYTNKWYCCAPGYPDSVCWTRSPTCSGDTKDTPSVGQIPCGPANYKFCCVKDAEMCTKTDNQINICWSTLANQLRKMDIQKLNDTYKSLLSASPSASAFPVASTALALLAQSTSSASARSSSASSSTGAPTSASASATPTNSAAPPPKDDGLSGGAIGGIVGGVVGGLALLGLAGFFFWRKRKNSTGKMDPHAQAGDPYQGYGYQPPYQPQPAYNPHQANSPQPGMAEAHSPQSPPLAKYAHHADTQVHEAPINNGPVEMDSGYYQQPAAAKQII